MTPLDVQLRIERRKAILAGQWTDPATLAVREYMRAEIEEYNRVHDTATVAPEPEYQFVIVMDKDTVVGHVAKADLDTWMDTLASQELQRIKRQKQHDAAVAATKKLVMADLQKRRRAPIRAEIQKQLKQQQQEAARWQAARMAVHRQIGG